MLKPKRFHQTRLAVRALILRENRLLLVNAYARGQSDLWCAPGGGAEPGQSLADNLVREVFEETGLTITPGPVVAVSEFTDPDTNFHQVELFFATQQVEGALSDSWQDPEQVVTTRRWVAQSEMDSFRLRPHFLTTLPWAPPQGLTPGPLLLKAP
ncbi:MAG: NUDIX domain-containing protein [Pseudomonadota bacterium]